MQTKGNLFLPASRAQLNEVANVILRCGNINKQYVNFDINLTNNFGSANEQ